MLIYFYGLRFKFLRDVIIEVKWLKREPVGQPARPGYNLVGIERGLFMRGRERERAFKESMAG